MLAWFFWVVSCSNSDDSTLNNNQDQISTNVQNGVWRITKFIDSGIGETYHFTGYHFTFKSPGILSATNGINNYDGSWSITSSSSNAHLYFNLSSHFEELNDDWRIISQSPTKIELIDVSGGNGGTDYLTFEKN